MDITIFDTDVGTDDAVSFAIWKNFFKDKPDYIVTGFGNTSLEGACINASILKKYFGLKSAIVKGADALKLSNSDEKNTFHGNDGLANIREELLKKLNLTEDEKSFLGLDVLEKAITESTGVTYVVVGPLTTLEGLLKKEEIKSKINRILVMGGGIKEFNCANNTEFNFSKNPVGVKNVLESGIPVYLFPLDLTNHQSLNDEEISFFEGMKTYREMIEFFKFNQKSNTDYNNINEAVLHDVLPVLYLASPEKFVIEEMKLACDKYGATILDECGVTINVAVNVKENFLEDSLKVCFEN